MQMTKKYFEKDFKASKSKESYLKVCKWLAINIINDKILKDSTWKISKVKETDDFTIFRLELFCLLDDTEITTRFCEVCKEIHCSFFINEEYNCNRCNMMTFRKRLKESLDVKTTYRKEIVKNKNL